ncbi:hypothetical protein D8B26_001620 [Coccidioides posadasii str. Silveira]|uniref:uncharacterized protein n=1 Tax=Coccidioides posadasii (strain RMSCC 757 / Silveira) TaxID=443226 RepID=UPI001BF09358|nr:hypothetical protein D8B26_001620 [Coccidioides posadasii str. Silveira]
MFLTSEESLLAAQMSSCLILGSYFLSFCPFLAFSFLPVLFPLSFTEIYRYPSLWQTNGGSAVISVAKLHWRATSPRFYCSLVFLFLFFPPCSDSELRRKVEVSRILGNSGNAEPDDDDSMLFSLPRPDSALFTLRKFLAF